VLLELLSPPSGLLEPLFVLGGVILIGALGIGVGIGTVFVVVVLRSINVDGLLIL
jgi:hypothetical protein